MSNVTQILRLAADWVAAQTPGVVTEAWPKGPTGPYKAADARYADYIQWINEIELQSGRSTREVVQRLRRLAFSTYTAPFKEGKAPMLSDWLISPLNYGPPLTTEDVSLATLDGLFGASSLITPSGLAVDISHVWEVVDLDLNGVSELGTAGRAYLDSDPRQIVGWAGDLASALNQFLTPAGAEFVRGGAAMTAAVGERCRKNDLLGDIDGANLGLIFRRHFDPLNPRNLGYPSFPTTAGGQFPSLVEILDFYYGSERLTATQAKALPYPNAKRRFHWFLNLGETDIPATTVTTTPLEMAIADRNAAIAAVRNILMNAADDLIMAPDGPEPTGSVEVDVERDAQRKDPATVDKLCAAFIDFLMAGLRDGDAPWPPTLT